jgi:hypothetical protein
MKQSLFEKLPVAQFFMQTEYLLVYLQVCTFDSYPGKDKFSSQPSTLVY